MSEAGRKTAQLVAGSGEIRHDARRLRWFVASFRRQVEILTEQTGVVFSVNERELATAFVAWLRRFEAHRANADLDRRDFTYFAAGLMLRELIRHAPLKAERFPSRADRDLPAYYWPEGYAYATYCMNVCEAVLTQEFGVGSEPAPDAEQIAFWWSFRENMREDTRWAIAFFDKLSGHEPNWDAPEFFLARHAVQTRLRELEGVTAPDCGLRD